MNPLARFNKKGVKDIGPQEPRREYTDHDLFSLEYLNNTMNYLLPGKNDFSHSYKFNSDTLEQIINEDVADLGMLVSERLKQMKPTCNPNLYSKDVQQYGDFINYQLSKAHQREMQSIEKELRQQIQFGMATKRLKRRYPWISQNISFVEQQRLIKNMKDEILQSLISDQVIIDENTFQQELQKNKLYRELFNLKHISALQKKQQHQRLSQAANVKYQQNQGIFIDSTGQAKPRKGRKSKKALEQKDLEYKPATAQKFIKKVKIGASRCGDNSEKPSRIEQQFENNPDQVALAKQSDANSKNKIQQEYKPHEFLFQQERMQVQPEKVNTSSLNTIGKSQGQAIYPEVDQNQKDLKKQAVVVKKRQPKVIKETIEGSSQNDKKSQKQIKVPRKRVNKKKVPLPIDIPMPIINPINPIQTLPKPDVAEVGIQADSECVSQNGQNNKIVMPTSANPLPNASMQIKRTENNSVQQQAHKKIQSIQSKKEKQRQEDQQRQQQIDHRCQINQDQIFEEQQKQQDPNGDDFIDKCID